MPQIRSGLIDPAPDWWVSYANEATRPKVMKAAEWRRLVRTHLASQLPAHEAVGNMLEALSA
jgi:hypothetical protein